MLAYRIRDAFRFCTTSTSFDREKLLELSLIHASYCGFNEKSIIQACQDLNISSAAQTLIKPIDLIHYSMRKWNKETLEHMANDEKFKEFKTTSKIKFLIHHRLNLQSQYVNRWNEAMAIGCQPQNAKKTSDILWQYADDSWYLSGDKSDDFNYYSKRILFLYVYITSELFMLTDKSTDYFMTWDFLERRLIDIHQIGSYTQIMKDILKTVSSNGYYMASMFWNFPISQDKSQQTEKKQEQ